VAQIVLQPEGCSSTTTVFLPNYVLAVVEASALLCTTLLMCVATVPTTGCLLDMVRKCKRLPTSCLCDPARLCQSYCVKH
jgi:hypothetical protein